MPDLSKTKALRLMLQRFYGGLWGARTLDIMVVTHALSQLS